VAYLVDGHNLIPKVRGLSLRDLDDEEQLIKKLQVFCQFQRTSIEVYFDGASAGFSGTKVRGCVKVHYIRKGFTADAAIIKRLHILNKAAHNWTVVTSDRRIQAEARILSAVVVSSEEFSSLMERVMWEKNVLSPTKEYSPNQGELDEWLRLFGEDNRAHS